MKKKINVGGQAVIEGVMIRGVNNYVVAVRKKKNIVTKHGKIPRKKHDFLKWLFVRGFINLVEMLIIGIRSLPKGVLEFMLLNCFSMDALFLFMDRKR